MHGSHNITCIYIIMMTMKLFVTKRGNTLITVYDTYMYLMNG